MGTAPRENGGFSALWPWAPFNAAAPPFTAAPWESSILPDRRHPILFHHTAAGNS